MALQPGNPVVGGTTLRRAAIASPDFVSGESGWSINQDGSAEFTGLQINSISQKFVVNSQGIFIYE